MEHSAVYQSLPYLQAVRNSTPHDRKTLLQNISRQQMRAISEVAKRLNNGTINPFRRDADLFERRRLMLRTLASARVGFERKKILVNRHHSTLPLMFRSIYLIQTIADEIQTTVEA